MAEADNTRRQPLLLNAIDPTDGKLITVQLLYDRLMVVSRLSVGFAKEAAFTVPHVLQRPIAIFEGLRRDEDEDPRGVGWRCYCGIPPCSYRLDGTDAPPHRGQVYMVFVNLDRIAYNWRWDKADCVNPDLPINYESRFKLRLL